MLSCQLQTSPLRTSHTCKNMIKMLKKEQKKRPFLFSFNKVGHIYIFKCMHTCLQMMQMHINFKKKKTQGKTLRKRKRHNKALQ